MARRQLALMVLVQILALSVWFSASAVLTALRCEWGLDRQGGIWLTAAVQIGFAVGVVVSAALTWPTGSSRNGCWPPPRCWGRPAPR